VRQREYFAAIFIQPFLMVQGNHEGCAKILKIETHCWTLCYCAFILFSEAGVTDATVLCALSRERAEGPPSKKFHIISASPLCRTAAARVLYTSKRLSKALSSCLRIRTHSKTLGLELWKPVVPSWVGRVLAWFGADFTAARSLTS
jgi:hypothetical protein